MLQSVIHSIERAQWERETRRRTHPFSWGLEHIGGPAAHDGDARAFLRRYADQALAESNIFFATGPAESYDFDGRRLVFPSAVQSPFAENNSVYGKWFPARSAQNGSRRRGPAVVVLPQWNAQPDSHVNICRVLAFFGISALRLSLPYHDERKPDSIERADYLVGPDIGLTLQANRQAVLDVRRAVRWLEQQSFDRIGLVGTSIGSCVGFITMCHEPAVRAAAFLHVSTYFADVVHAGLTTSHVWAGLEEQVTLDELRHYWAPISPFPYLGRLKGTGKKFLMVTARYDLSFPYELSQQLHQALDAQGIEHERLILPCGHYTLGKLPFSWWAGLRFVPFLLRSLR
ncbi:MAG TPA: prolyl oligopeptidase family serine peptidase [Candidatus Xenobia bacterium]|nr:prolyl oligopeptidase family serine peptidase [Candidatus Xenobia bacterium]